MPASEWVSPRAVGRAPDPCLPKTADRSARAREGARQTTTRITRAGLVSPRAQERAGTCWGSVRCWGSARVRAERSIAMGWLNWLDEVTRARRKRAYRGRYGRPLEGQPVRAREGAAMLPSTASAVRSARARAGRCGLRRGPGACGRVSPCQRGKEPCHDRRARDRGRARRRTSRGAASAGGAVHPRSARPLQRKGAAHDHSGAEPRGRGRVARAPRRLPPRSRQPDLRVSADPAAPARAVVLAPDAGPSPRGARSARVVSERAWSGAVAREDPGSTGRAPAVHTIMA